MFAIGDTHGDVSVILRWNHENEGQNLIHVGDLHTDFYSLQSVAKKLSKKNNKMYCIRGNHESNYYKFDGTILEDSVTLVEDYSIYTIEGKRIAFVGGAVSLDRKKRIAFKILNPGLENWYNPDEEIKYVKYNWTDIDILVTHTTHEKFISKVNQEFLKFFAEKDPSLLDDIERERAAVLKLYDDVIEAGAKLALFGHWHLKESGTYKSLKYRGLEINELIKIDESIGS